MLKKIYNLLINIKNKFYTTNHKDFYSNISSYILNLIKIMFQMYTSLNTKIILLLSFCFLFLPNILRLINYYILNLFLSYNIYIKVIMVLKKCYLFFKCIWINFIGILLVLVCWLLYKILKEYSWNNIYHNDY